MRMMAFRALFLLSIGSPAMAQRAPVDDFNMLFATTCMQYFSSPEGLRKAMIERGAIVLATEQAEFFLGRKPGTAWMLTSADTRLVVSLRDDTLCAVFAQRAESAAVQRGFISLVAIAPAPLVAQELDGAEFGPVEGPTKTIAYSWGRSKDQSELVFVLTTTDGSAVKVQAMASMAVTKKAN